MTQDQLLGMYRRMLTIRMFEKRVKKHYRAGEISGAIHLYTGQEAIAVGVCDALRDTDYVVSTHRGHGHLIAKGGDVKQMMAELMGKQTGCSRGFGGSMHMFDLERGFLGGNGLVGGGIPIALGAAFSAHYRGTDSVAVTFFSEGAANQGTFHETMNMASLWKMPFVAVCENNQYGATTPLERSTAGTIVSRASGYAMTGVEVDGNDCAKVFETTEQAVRRARNGKGPTLIECLTYRVEPHCGIIADQRPDGERERWVAQADPLDKIKQYMPDFGPDQEKQITAEVKQQLDDAVQFARTSTPLSPAEMFEQVTLL